MSASTRFGNERGGGRRRRSSAFTLVELLVVIAIIVLLLGLAAAMGPAILNRGAEQVTTSRLQNLQTIYETYMSVTDQTNENGKVAWNMNEFLEVADDLEGLTAPLKALGDGFKREALYLPVHPDESASGDWEFEMVGDGFRNADDTTKDGDEKDRVSETKPLTVLDGWENAIFLKVGDGMVGGGQVPNDVGESYFFDPIGEINGVEDGGNNPSGFRPAKIPDVGHAYFASPGPNGLWGRVAKRPAPPQTVIDDPDFIARYISGNWWNEATPYNINVLDLDEDDEERGKDNIYRYEVGE